MRKKRDNSSLIMLLAAMNSNLEKLTASMMDIGRQLQSIDKHLFEIRLDNLRGTGKGNGLMNEGKQN